jgi:hypothetical protein
MTEQTVSIIVDERTLEWWETQTGIDARTLARWAKFLNLGKPYTEEKMVDILSHGIGKAAFAVGASKRPALINAEKAERAIAWLP